jgi:hypothetical protein
MLPYLQHSASGVIAQKRLSGYAMFFLLLHSFEAATKKLLGKLAIRIEAVEASATN